MSGIRTELAFDADGWCSRALRDPSPNCDARPQSEVGLVDISLLVIHYISLPPGHYGGPYVADLFCNRLDIDADPSFADLRGIRVSAHFLIGRDGGLTQFVAARQRAWHAGVSSFAGRPACNDFSIGVEMEGCETEPFTDLQYETLCRLTVALQSVAPLTDVVGHQHIAPGRKADPGPFFDWKRYRSMLAQAFPPASMGVPLHFPFLPQE